MLHIHVLREIYLQKVIFPRLTPFICVNVPYCLSSGVRSRPVKFFMLLSCFLRTTCCFRCVLLSFDVEQLCALGECVVSHPRPSSVEVLL